MTAHIGNKKVFIFSFILIIMGLFIGITSYQGGNSFNRVENVLLKKYKSAGTLRQKTLEIIGIYYLLSGDQDLDMQMVQLQRYDGLAEEFQAHLKSIRAILASQDKTANVTQASELANQIETLFEALNTNARIMTLSVMEGNRQGSKTAFLALSKDLSKFQKLVEDFEELIVQELRKESTSAQQLLRGTSAAGFIIFILTLLF